MFSNKSNVKPKRVDDVAVGCFLDKQGTVRNIKSNGINNKYKIISLLIYAYLRTIQAKYSVTPPLLDDKDAQVAQDKINSILNNSLRVSAVTSLTDNRDEIQTLNNYYEEQDLFALIYNFINPTEPQQFVNTDKPIDRDSVRTTIPGVSLVDDESKVVPNLEYLNELKGMILGYYKNDQYVKEVCNLLGELEIQHNKDKVDEAIKHLNGIDDALKYKITIENFKVGDINYFIDFGNKTDDPNNVKILSFSIANGPTFYSDEILEYSDVLIKCKKDGNYFYFDRKKGLIIISNEEIDDKHFTYKENSTKVTVSFGNSTTNKVTFKDNTGGATTTDYPKKIFTAHFNDFRMLGREKCDGELTFALPEKKDNVMSVSNEVFWEEKVAPLRLNQQQQGALRQIQELSTEVFNLLDQDPKTNKDKYARLYELRQKISVLETATQSIEQSTWAKQNYHFHLAIKMIHGYVHAVRKYGLTDWENAFTRAVFIDKRPSTPKMERIKNNYAFFHSDLVDFITYCQTGFKDKEYHFFKNSIHRTNKISSSLRKYNCTYESIDYVLNNSKKYKTAKEQTKDDKLIINGEKPIMFRQKIYLKNGENTAETMKETDDKRSFTPIEGHNTNNGEFNNDEKDVIFTKLNNSTSIDYIYNIYNKIKNQEAEEKANKNRNKRRETLKEKEKRIEEAIKKGEMVLEANNKNDFQIRSIEHSINQLNSLGEKSFFEKLWNFFLSLIGKDNFKQQYENAVKNFQENSSVISQLAKDEGENLVASFKQAITKAYGNLWSELSNYDISYNVTYNLSNTKKNVKNQTPQ